MADARTVGRAVPGFTRVGATAGLSTSVSIISGFTASSPAHDGGSTALLQMTTDAG